MYPNLFNLFDNSENQRLRWATAWVITQLTKFSPQLIFKNEENLKILFDSGVSHIQQDHIQIAALMASAWGQAYQAVANMEGKTLLNNYFYSVVNTLVECMFKEETMTKGQFFPITDAINSVFELCDY